MEDDYGQSFHSKQKNTIKTRSMVISSNSSISYNEDSSYNDYDKSSPISNRRRKRKDTSESPLKSSAKKQTKFRKNSKLNSFQDKKARRGGDNNGATLFNIINQGKVSLQSIADEWIDSYKEDKSKAMICLFQFFLDSSGCKGKLSLNMFENSEYSDIVRVMTEQFDEDGGDYPIISASGRNKKYRSVFSDFVSILIKQCQHSIIYESDMSDKIIKFLVVLSDSQVRAFRHTGTFAVLKIMTAFVDIAINLTSNLDFTQRQIDLEKQKSNKEKSTERIEMLTRKKDDVTEGLNEISSHLTYMFRSLFVHRYRDVVPDIRGMCMYEIGIWMKKFPGDFLSDIYLKYIGWTLYDKIGDVRLKCLQSLQPLYANRDTTSKLELFTNKFKERLIAMTLDKESDVAVNAVKLVISILKYHREHLSDSDCESIYELVYSINRPVAQAAGEFLKERIFTLDEDSLRKTFKTKSGKRRLPNTTLIRDLVQFYIESDLHEHGAYLVDSLIESNDMVKDWECMTDLLLEEPGRNEEALDDQQETCLIEIMSCSVKQAATGESPVGRAPTKKMHISVKENKQISEDKAKLSHHFMATLPSLLNKYCADVDKLCNLLQISQHLDVEIFYTSPRLEAQLQALLKAVDELCLRHTHSALLTSCAHSYEHFCTIEHNSKIIVSKSMLIDTLAQKFSTAYQSYVQLKDDLADEDVVFALKASLSRIEAFSRFHDISSCALWPSFYGLLKSSVDYASLQPLPIEIVKSALSCCHFNLCFSIVCGMEQGNSEASASLSNQLSHFIQTAQELMYARSGIEEDAFLSICDILIYSNQNQEDSNNTSEMVVYQANESLIKQLNSFILEKVFVEQSDDDDDEHLSKSRLFLASFCKLFIHKAIPIVYSVDVLRNFTKFYVNYHDIIKGSLVKVRERQRIGTAKVMIKALQLNFKALLDEHFSQNGTPESKVAHWNEGYHALTELARRFASLLGPNIVKNREALATIHKKGIEFSLKSLSGITISNLSSAPKNVFFFDVVSEFSSKLIKQDKKTVYIFDLARPQKTAKRKSEISRFEHTNSLFLLSTLPGDISKCVGEEWQPLHSYKNSLQYAEEENANSTRRGRPPFSSRNSTLLIASELQQKSLATIYENDDKMALADAATNFEDFQHGVKMCQNQYRSTPNAMKNFHVASSSKDTCDTSSLV